MSYTLESIINDADNIEDDNLINEMIELHKKASKELDKLSFRQLFKGENDYADAYIDIQSGSGGTEAQDWVAMIMRMYLCLLYTSPSPRDATLSRMPSSA